MTPTACDVLGVAIVAVCFTLACLMMPADPPVRCDGYGYCEVAP